MLALRQKGTEHLAYLLNCHAPAKPGRYRIVMQTIGASQDIADLETFVEGEIEVR